MVSFFANQTDDEIRDYCNGDNVTKESTCDCVLGIMFEVSNNNYSVVVANAYFKVFLERPPVDGGTACQQYRRLCDWRSIHGSLSLLMIPTSAINCPM